MLEKFYEAARAVCSVNPLILANEWRDTIGYTVGGAFVASQLGRHDEAVLLFLLGSGREFIRGAAWTVHRHKSRMPLHNRYILSLSAAAGAMGNAGAMLLVSSAIFARNGAAPHVIGAGLVFSGCVFGVACLISVPVGGPVRALRNYQNPMWDYPRKKGGGGTTQTQKLKDGFAALAVKNGSNTHRLALYNSPKAAIKSVSALSPSP